MTSIKFVLPLFFLPLLLACNRPEKQDVQDKPTGYVEEKIEEAADAVEQDSAIANTIEDEYAYASAADTTFVVLNTYAHDFAYEMKYATEDNFLKEKVYTCDQCLIRKEVADALKNANNNLRSRGLRIKFYDCYRPLDIQKKMWKIYPNPSYVANPYSSTGSIHNRGGAVDITLVTLDDQELEMGTSFDHFGKEAHHAYTNLPDTVLSNRRLLKETMEIHGFNAITSEWWHYSFRAASRYPVSNFSVDCE